jgi:nucleotide-binding universal stress UspA family protein
VWSGRELLLYGVVHPSKEAPYGAGAAYNPATNTWRKLPRAPGRAETMEGGYTTVWTGSEMLGQGLGLNLAYNPTTNRWRSILGFSDSTAVTVWTGRQLLSWGGGCCGSDSAEGAAYTPATNARQQLPPAPLAGRHTSGAWTGTELIVVGGGNTDGRIFRDAAAYNPTTRSRRRLPPMPAPRTGATATWTGTEVLVVGGHHSGILTGGLYADGVAYNPATNRWRQLPGMEVGRIGHSAVWTGRQLLVWGGQTVRAGVRTAPPHGLAYDPAANRWSTLPTAPLRGRTGHLAVWTGDQMLVWGGSAARDPRLRAALRQRGRLHAGRYLGQVSQATPVDGARRHRAGGPRAAGSRLPHPSGRAGLARRSWRQQDHRPCRRRPASPRLKVEVVTMSATPALLAVAAIWLSTGLLLGLAMGRHGYDPFAWWLLGTVLGPLAIPVALSAAHWPQDTPRVVQEGVAAAGPVDLLVGIDGSPQAAAALLAALELVGSRLGRLTLVAVTSLDDSVERRRREAGLRAELERQSAAACSWLAVNGLAPAGTRREPRMVLCAGRPAQVLRRLAAEGGYDLLVIGAHGTGLSKALLGSTATALAAESEVPVLLAHADRSPADGRVGQLTTPTPAHSTS